MYITQDLPLGCSGRKLRRDKNSLPHTMPPSALEGKERAELTMPNSFQIEGG